MITKPVTQKAFDLSLPLERNSPREAMMEMPVKREAQEADVELRVQLPEETEDREHTQDTRPGFPVPSVKSTVALPAGAQVSYANKMPMLPTARAQNMPVLSPQSSLETTGSWPQGYPGSPIVMRHGSTSTQQSQNVQMHPASPQATAVMASMKGSPHVSHRGSPVVGASRVSPSACRGSPVVGAGRVSPSMVARGSPIVGSPRVMASMKGSPHVSHRGSPIVGSPRVRQSPSVPHSPSVLPQQVMAAQVSHPTSPQAMAMRHGGSRGTPPPVMMRPATPHAMIQPTTPSHAYAHEYMMTPTGAHDPFANAFMNPVIDQGHQAPAMMPQTAPPQCPQTPMTPTHCLMSVKPADQMDHIEASRWIGTIGRLKKWAEADTYAANCMAHEISGFMLSQLTMADLENVLGMKKHGHRLELWCSIRQIFPYLLPFERKKRDPVCDANEIQKWNSRSSSEVLGSVKTSMLTFRRARSHGRSALSSGSRTYCMSETSGSRTASVYTKGTNRSVRSGANDSVRSGSTAAKSAIMSTRLLLTLRPEQVVEDKIGTMTKIRNYFLEKGFKVEIGTVDMDDRRFILFFRDDQETNRALSMNEDLDYDVAPYAEPMKKRSKRPTPAEPIRYMVLNRSRLRAGKSMKSEWRGELYKGDIVWVNQIKGRRARIIRAKDDPTVRGWVSLRSNNGFQLLTQFQDNE